MDISYSYISDCDSPFSLTFNTNKNIEEAPTATAVQRGDLKKSMINLVMSIT